MQVWPFGNQKSPIIHLRMGPQYRIRHKKCDEALLVCRNCNSTGRKYDGYVQVPDKRTRVWRKVEKPHSGDQTAMSGHKQYRAPHPFDECYGSSGRSKSGSSQLDRALALRLLPKKYSAPIHGVFRISILELVGISDVRLLMTLLDSKGRRINVQKGGW